MIVRAGSIIALYLFDIADEVDLAAVPGLVQARAAPARLAPKPFTPAYVQYQQPPIVIEGEAIDLGRVDQALLAGPGLIDPTGPTGPAGPAGSTDSTGSTEPLRGRAKVYDYGVISLAISQPIAGSWDDLAACAQRLGALDAPARAWGEQLRAQLAPALSKSRPISLSEDYLLFVVHELDPALTADTLIARDADAIARLLRGERAPLSDQERDEVLRHRLSYFADDLVVPTWNAALVVETEAGAQAALEIFEYANSQLLQFRYYDDRLDSELARIYDSLERPRWYHALAGRRYVRAAQQLHALFIDVNELTDKTENALKMVGDPYAARLYALVAARLGLDRWKQNVEEKLDTLDDIYRFTVEQTQMSRGHLLELTIVLILILELVLVFMGIMQ